MRFFTSGLMFDSSDYCSRWRFHDNTERNNYIIKRWNDVVTEDDEVIILGGIGEFEYLNDLKGKKTLMMDTRDMNFYLSYVSAITNVRDEFYDKEMFEVYVIENYDVEKVIFNTKIMRKLYSGRVVSVTTDKTPYTKSDRFSIVSGNDYIRFDKKLINVEFGINYMTLVSEVNIENLIRKAERSKVS